MLPNGNFLVGDWLFDAPGPVVDVGALYLYRADGVLISSLYGSTANDRIGSEGVEVLSNGNFVVRSPFWDNGALVNAGAVTWGSAVTGVGGMVSTSNSLVGAAAGDAVGGRFAGEAGNLSVTPLANGHYVVRTPLWDNVGAADAGAVTWGDGTQGVSGVIGVGNSLVGTTDNDRIGSGRIQGLSNGNYVVSSPDWDHGGVANVGAVTWADGMQGRVGSVGSSNSLIGSTAGDAVGDYSIGAAVALSNGHYVVVSPHWHNAGIAEAGAATWGNGTSGIVGVVSAGNSLVGSHFGDGVGHAVALSNGNYVVVSSGWDNALTVNVGAVTWADGAVGISGLIGIGNSLLGASTDDYVGSYGVIPLRNGHYVVNSPSWSQGAILNVGASTWGNGEMGSTGVVTAGNSLIGSSTDDQIGYCGITPLSSGHYAVCSSQWNRGALTDAGAVTWRDGTGSSNGIVAPNNSLVGTRAGDKVGFGLYSTVRALSSGKYVVPSRDWDNGAIANAGAITLCDAGGATTGEITAANSLVGTTADDQLGDHGVVPKEDGGYVVISARWDDTATVNAGAVTWGDGDTGVVGAVTPSNSLVGSTPNDFIGGIGASVYNDGRVLFPGFGWDNGALVNAGAVTLAAAGGNTTGFVNADNSVLGRAANAGLSVAFDYDPLRAQMIVGQDIANVVTIYRPGLATNASITTVTPSPSIVDEPVAIFVQVSASVAATLGIVRIVASTGEECLTSEVIPIDTVTAGFSCPLVFQSALSRTLRAEFFGTATHGYSASIEVPHIVQPDPGFIFSDGYE